MRKLDPIEAARQQLLGAPKSIESTTPAAATPNQPGHHPMQSFEAANGKVYERRADITMAEWRQYGKEGPATTAHEMYWVALFLGKLQPETRFLELSERIELAEQVLGEITTDEYFMLMPALIDSILMPASPKNDQAQESANDTTPQESASGS